MYVVGLVKIQYIHPELLKKSYKVIGSTSSVLYGAVALMNPTVILQACYLRTVQYSIYCIYTVLLLSTIVLYTLSKQMQNLPLM